MSGCSPLKSTKKQGERGLEVWATMLMDCAFNNSGSLVHSRNAPVFPVLSLCKSCLVSMPLEISCCDGLHCSVRRVFCYCSSKSCL